MTADALAVACVEKGAESLTRSAIAKVEANRRRLRADEAETMALILEVSATYLLGLEGSRVFLSFAEEERELADEIAEQLGDRWFDVLDPARQRNQATTQLEADIRASDAFVVLLSPSYLVSPQCRLEHDLAVRLAGQQDATPSTAFIHVLKVRETPYSDAGQLRAYDWADLTSPDSRDADLDRLAIALEASMPSGAIQHIRSSSGSAEHGVRPTGFRDRHAELAMLVDGLLNSRGPHFWFVIAPPGLGKTTFLAGLREQVAGLHPRWATDLVDIREQPPDVRGDAGALLARCFGLSSHVTAEPETLRGIAQEISRGGRPHLCLLDSAELLPEQTAHALRSGLSEIYRLVQHTGNVNVWLAVIVASRRDDGWRGVFPDPRFSFMKLAEFDVDVVEDALREAAGPDRGSRYSDARFRHIAELVRRLTEGLPALLDPALRWISAEEWLDVERLEEQEVFEERVRPYVHDTLLAADSILPQARQLTRTAIHALTAALQILAPYRMFTQSHLRYHLESDEEFRHAVERAQWKIEDLWTAISSTALLQRPLDEPWQEIHAAIRRLLYRYFYHSDDERADAHRTARKFVEIWSGRQFGKEQVIGLVECLWHEAAVLRLERPAELARNLIDSAGRLSGELRPSGAYTVSELRAYAAERIRNDEEFQESIGNDVELVGRLVDAIVAKS
ncbi:MAG: toll/interleukin-1 receptor domain-containing protein [Streptosporangiaceae bacterium]|nr:toll/interleukin-1 receptor domain-containing protein [Streptosporangiaceae bacterium]